MFVPITSEKRLIWNHVSDVSASLARCVGSSIDRSVVAMHRLVLDVELNITTDARDIIVVVLRHLYTTIVSTVCEFFFLHAITITVLITVVRHVENNRKHLNSVVIVISQRV